MPGRIALISDDSDFFDFIKLKLELRNSDELYTFKFDDVPEQLEFLQNSLLIVNSENSNQKSLDLLNIFNHNTPVIITAYNDNEAFKRKCYRAGMLDFIPLLTPDAEFRARMMPALNLLALLEKNKQYRQILVKNKILAHNNEIYNEYEKVIDNALNDLKITGAKAVLGAIAPDEKNKYLIPPNVIETFLTNNIRNNDILMKYAYNKYYLIMNDTDLSSAQKHWDKIKTKFNHKIYAGFVEITNQSRQQLVNAALVKLHEDFGAEVNEVGVNGVNFGTENYGQNNGKKNFKQIRKELAQRLEVLIHPVFYRMQQKYSNRLSGVKIEQSYGNGLGYFNISGKHFMAVFEISSPGFSKIIINIEVKKSSENTETKRISFNPDEFDESLLEDLLEQFIVEIKNNYCS